MPEEKSYLGNWRGGNGICTTDMFDEFIENQDIEIQGLFMTLIRILGVMLMFNALCAYAENTPAKPVSVVTTFSILADWVEQVGGEQVRVHSLVGADEDVHVYQASPADVQVISQADLLVMNGLGLEGWLGRLIDSSAFRGERVIASKGLQGISQSVLATGHDHGHHHGHHQHDLSPNAENYIPSDPHAWLSLKAAIIYLENIEHALIQIAPQHHDYFHQRTQAYIDKLNALAQRMTAQIQAIPAAQRRIVVPHNAFAYMARDFELEVFSLQGLSTDAETSAAHMAYLLRTIQAKQVKAIFSENVMNNRLIQQVASEAKLALGGPLISGALSKSLAPNYLAMMQHNLEQIVTALNKAKDEH